MEEKTNKVIHICGRAGANYVKWLMKWLYSRKIRVSIIDCTKDKFIYRQFRQHDFENRIFLADEVNIWCDEKEILIMYHEEPDFYTEKYDGLYLLFTTGYGVDYIKLLIDKLTYGKMMIYERTLYMQLLRGRRTYLCVLYRRKIRGEEFLPTTLLDSECMLDEKKLVEITKKYACSYLLQ